MQHYAFWFGIVLVVAGFVMLAYQKESASANEMELFGMRFRLSHPSLVIIVLGFVLIIMKGGESGESDGGASGPPTSETAGASAGANSGNNQTAATKAQESGSDTAAGGIATTDPAPAATVNGADTLPPADAAAAPAADQSAVPVASAADAAADAESVAAEAAASASIPNPPARMPAQAASASPVWVYLGPAGDDYLESSTFNLVQLPVAGQVIEAKSDVNKRTAAPVYNSSEGWQFGTVVGLVRGGERVAVRRLEKIPTTQGRHYIWAEVDLLPAPD